ncbi:MAG: UbiA family prenyltransferase [Agathobacter sp.]
MKMLKELSQIFRVGEWYDSKVPMLLLPALYIMITSGTASTGNDLGIVLLLLVFDSVFLAFGYLINDYADMEVDKKAGKEKIIHRLPALIPFFLVIGSVVLGCLPVLFVSHEWKTILVLVIIYFFGGSYSAPPLRFKERGILGLLVSSTAQRCFPLLLIPILLDVPVDGGYVLWMLLSFCVGIRYILVHQYIDAENDRRTGVETYVIHHQLEVAVLIKCAFAAELVITIILLVPVCQEYRWTIVFLMGYAFLSLIRWRGCKMVYGHGGLYSFDQVPLEDFYNHFLPLIFVILLMQQDLWWGILFVGWMMVLLRPTIRHLEFPAKIWKNQRRGKRG